MQEGLVLFPVVRYRKRRFFRFSPEVRKVDTSFCFLYKLRIMYVIFWYIAQLDRALALTLKPKDYHRYKSCNSN